MEFSNLLLNWYLVHRRELPWRDQPDPYAVWVSEVMLQQTRVETVLTFYTRWMERFPVLEALARAEQQEVLRAWEGLGYYRRARNLHAAAQQVMADHGAVLPSDPASLRRLPGIGAYTAAAIASLAFNLDVPLVDGNVRRVLARIIDLEIPADAPTGERQLLAWAEAHLPAGQARDYNQALMELGALVCTPRRPDCSRCPLSTICASLQAGTQLERPVLKPKAAVPHFTVTAAVIRRGKCVLIAQRPPNGLLGGMWEFPGGKLEPGEDFEGCLRREIEEELGVALAIGAPLGIYRHGYTHFKVTLHAFDCRLEPAGQTPSAKGVAAVLWVSLDDLKQYPMGKIDRRIAGRLLEDQDA